MNDTSNPADLVQQGLTALENGLSSLLLTSEDQARPDEDHTVRLQSIISEIDSYYGHDSRAFLLAYWALQLHLLLQTRACELTRETTLCDLERLRELADFFSLRDVADEIQGLADRAAAGPGGSTPFASVSGGFANLGDLATATLRAIDERMEALGGASFREAVSTEVELLETLTSEDLVGRYILDASQDRRRCCVCLATMVMVIRELLRMGETGSGTAETADAQRLAQLGELVGIMPVNVRRNPLPKEAGGSPASEPEPTDTEAPGAAAPQADDEQGAALFPDSEPAEPVKRQPEADPDAEGDLTVDVASRHLPEPPPPEPEWEPEPLPEEGGAGPEPGPEPAAAAVPEAPEDPDAEVEEALAETEAPGQGLGQMLLMLLMALVGVGIVALVVIQPAWLDNLTSQGQTDTGNAQAVAPEPEEAAPTAAPVPTETPAQPAAEPEPTPVPPTPTPVDGYVFLATAAQVYLWPDIAADIVGSREADSGVVLVRRVADGDRFWLQMEDTFFIPAEAVSSPEIVEQLPLIDKADIPDIPAEFVQAPAAADEAPADGGDQTPAEPVPEPTPDDRTAIVSDEDARVGPGEEFDSRGLVPAGREVNLIGTSADGAWSLMDDFHWIRSAAVVNIPDGLPVLNHPTTNTNANLRAAPDSNSAQRGVLGPGTALLLDGWTLGSNPDGIWYHLDTGEWIYSELVQDAYASLPERPYVPDGQ